MGFQRWGRKGGRGMADQLGGLWMTLEFYEGGFPRRENSLGVHVNCWGKEGERGLLISRME